MDTIRPLSLGVTNDVRNEDLTVHIFTAPDAPPDHFLLLSAEQSDYLIKALTEARTKQKFKESNHEQ